MAKQVLVTTSSRGVFFGTLVGEPSSESVTLFDARNVLYWAPEVKGVLGLAERGPIGASRVGPAVPTLILYGITAIAECTQDAIEVWESAPWSP